ncbi:MAG TPA: YetF domain-containing protein [Pyrinomonadaceae bacterium]|nr:YetF domain-containing protein [Pyrinomonadaceae bacterium]
METLLQIDWQSMFVPTTSIVEVILRGTIMYLGMFVLLRIFRRQSGSISMADLLVIVIIADAAQNGMAGDAKSVVEALILIGTIIAWDYIIDWLGFKSVAMSRVLEPQPLMLVKNGRLLRKNMETEMLTEDEVMSQLRLQGVDDIRSVKECRLESNGEFSVIELDHTANRGNKTTKKGVN